MSRPTRVDIDPREIVARLQAIESEINMLRTQIAAVNDEVLALRMAKASVEAAEGGFEEVLVPGDPKGNIMLKTSGLKNDEILVRISRQVYAPLPPQKAVGIIEKRINELQNVASSIEERINQLTKEYAVLSRQAEVLMQAAKTQGKG